MRLDLWCCSKSVFAFYQIHPDLYIMYSLNCTLKLTAVDIFCSVAHTLTPPQCRLATFQSLLAPDWFAVRVRQSLCGRDSNNPLVFPCAVDGTPRQTRADSRAAAAASTVRALVRGIRTLNRTSNHPEHCLFRRIIPICFLKHHSPRVCEVLFKTRTL